MGEDAVESYYAQEMKKGGIRWSADWLWIYEMNGVSRNNVSSKFTFTFTALYQRIVGFSSTRRVEYNMWSTVCDSVYGSCVGRGQTNWHRAWAGAALISQF